MFRRFSSEITVNYAYCVSFEVTGGFHYSTFVKYTLYILYKSAIMENTSYLYSLWTCYAMETTTR